MIRRCVCQQDEAFIPFPAFEGRARNAVPGGVYDHRARARMAHLWRNIVSRPVLSDSESHDTSNPGVRCNGHSSFDPSLIPPGARVWRGHITICVSIYLSITACLHLPITYHVGSRGR